MGDMVELFGWNCLLTSWRYLTQDRYWQDHSKTDGSLVIVSEELWLWSGVSGVWYWRRWMFILQLELLLLLHRWYNQRAHSFVLVFSRFQNQFLGWLKLFSFCRYLSPLERAVTELLFPCSIYAFIFGTWFPRLLVYTRRKPLQLYLQLLILVVSCFKEMTF